jgi:uncharacterized protein YjiS (DUF1127 family)
MSIISSAPAAAQSTVGHSRVCGLAATLKRWCVVFITWRLEQAVIGQLWSMSDRNLKDIGLTRSEIRAVVKGRITRERAFRRCS